MFKTRYALLGILTMMSGAILAVPTEAAERYIPGVTTKRGQSDGSAIPTGAPISTRRSGRSAIPMSFPTMGVTTLPSTTTATGITALLTIGNTAATAAVPTAYAPAARRSGSSRRTRRRRAVKREAEEAGANDRHSFAPA